MFAARFYLGAVDFGNPWTLICARSPDGMKVAYVSDPFHANPPENYGFLRWFDLDFPIHGAQIPLPLSGVFATQFTFSPDSRQLAVFGYDGQFAMGTLFIVDLDTGKSQTVYHQGDLRSLIWSPDGKYLAFIGRDAPPKYNDQVMVLDLASEKVVYRDPIDTESGRGSEWPMNHWGIDGSAVEFPVEMGTLAGCALPPKPIS